MLHGAGIIEYDNPETRRDFHYFIIESMANDHIGKMVKNDSGILNFGKCQFEKLGRQRASGVRYSMRLLIRIKQNLLLESPVGDGPGLVSYLRPENFTKFITSVKKWRKKLKWCHNV